MTDHTNGNHERQALCLSSLLIKISAAIMVIGTLTSSSASAQQMPAQPDHRQPVLVELFTSEGCSTCPPADNFLMQLVERQPIPNAEIIGLGLHVDYWDAGGWVDRYSSGKYTDRQKTYDSRMKIETFTPQMVIDGQQAMVGADGPTVAHAIAQSAATPKPVEVKLTRQPQKIGVAIQGDPGHNTEAFYALVEDGVETVVKDGENKGKTLHHAAVVRDMRSIGKPSNPSWTAEVPLKLQSGEKLAMSHAVVFLQDRKSGKILGLAEINLQ